MVFCFYHNGHSQEVNPFLDTLIYNVSGKCGSCKDRIETVSILSEGVMKASYNIEEQQLRIVSHIPSYDEKVLHKNIAKAGHDTEIKKAPLGAYNVLPACCKYRDVEEAIEPNDFVLGDGKDGIFKDVINQHDHGEDKVCGMIYEEDKLGNREPLIGATVLWLGTDQGTTTDIDGHFELDKGTNLDKIVISYVSYQPDTIDMTDQSMVSVVLTNAVLLDQVEVVHRKKTTEISYLNPIKVQNIGQKELLKAACCNVAESFETTPAVDVTFTDAVTGTRKIQMLGLEGPYIQIMRENIPYIRGLSAVYGLTYTPGPWLQGIQLNLGTGSVTNGFESFTGQINLEVRKPEDMDQVYLNLFVNEGGRTEANAVFRHKVSDKWFAGTLLHGKYTGIERDRNDDNFLDNPLNTSFIGMHRWKYFGDDGYRFQIGLKATYLENVSGQIGYNNIKDQEVTNLWGARVLTNRFEGWIKNGKVFEDNPFKSIGFQLSGVYHDQKANYGDLIYDAKQKSFYSNLIFQNIIGNSGHKYKVGLSYQYDNFEEMLGVEYLRNESVPGAFLEYTYSFLEKFNLILGLRGDHHNNFGFFATPRLHLRWAPNEAFVLRAAAGRAQRTASIFAENTGMFASSRRISLFPDADPSFPYGLNPEVAWNYGINLSKMVKINNREAVFGLDYYYTDFQDQVVFDYDDLPNSVLIYNLGGRSYSSSIQAQIDYEILPQFDMRIAYRFNDVKTKFTDEVLEKPLISRNRAFLNLAYETAGLWNFDATLNWQGTKRIPSTLGNPPNFRRPDESPSFFIINAQVSKTFANNLDIYLGAENLLNFRQDDPIISVENPFGEFFDSSLVWGPVFGRNIYAGLRYTIK